MPREVLTPEAGPEAGQDDDHRPVAGFFGKLPSTGDFVSRGLPEAFRRHWDAWITRTVAPLQRDGVAFPDGGLRFRLVSGGRLAAGVILPSQDSAGRLFPLSLLFIAEGGLARPAIDAWCDAALALAPDVLTPDALWLALDDLPAPEPKGPAIGPMQLWTPGVPEVSTDPDIAGDTVRQLLGPGEAFSSDRKA
jgi:type VI secretion system protein ImpM